MIVRVFIEVKIFLGGYWKYIIVYSTHVVNIWQKHNNIKITKKVNIYMKLCVSFYFMTIRYVLVGYRVWTNESKLRNVATCSWILRLYKTQRFFDIWYTFMHGGYVF
jgi:uncharacterized membrane protein YiaA